MEKDTKEVMERIRDGKNKYNKLHSVFKKNFTLEGKSLAEIQDHFSITVPKDANIQTCKELMGKLAKLHHEATFFLNISAVIDKSLILNKDKAYREAYNAEIKSYTDKGKSIPAAATLKAIADLHTQDSDDMMTNAAISKEFWKNIINHLKYLQKLLNDITINNGYEIKLGSNP